MVQADRVHILRTTRQRSRRSTAIIKDEENPSQNSIEEGAEDE
jgi:hypothetical protein